MTVFQSKHSRQKLRSSNTALKRLPGMMKKIRWHNHRIRLFIIWTKFNTGCTPTNQWNLTEVRFDGLQDAARFRAVDHIDRQSTFPKSSRSTNSVYVGVVVGLTVYAHWHVEIHNHSHLFDVDACILKQIREAQMIYYGKVCRLMSGPDEKFKCNLSFLCVNQAKFPRQICKQKRF